MAIFQSFKRYAGPERRIAKPSLMLIGLSAAAVCGIAYATLCPIGMRPHLASADEERFGAYFVMGALVAMAAPRRWLSITLFVAAVAAGLEAGQLLIPGRDARVGDALVKMAGGVLGAQAVFCSFAVRRFTARMAVKLRGPAVAPEISG